MKEEEWSVVAWSGGAGAVISTVFEWECFQWGDVSSSDSFDKCQEDSQGNQEGRYSTSRTRMRRKDKVQAFAGVLLVPGGDQHGPDTKFKTRQLINTALH